MIQNHLKNLDWWLFLSVVFLVLISVLMLFAGIKYDGENSIFLQKQALFLGVGMVIMIVVSFFDYRRLRGNPAPVILLYLGSVASLLAVLSLGFEVRGSESWFKVGGFSIEPVEFVKIVILALLAKFFTLRHAEIYRLSHLAVSAIYMAIPVGLVLLQPDFGSAMLLILLWVGMMMVAGIKKRHLAFLFVLGGIALTIMWFGFFKDYQKARIVSFLNPLSDPYGSGYNIIQARIAIGSGGLFGEGLGQGSQTRLGFLPEAHTDFIFAAIAEEIGLIGVFFVFAGYALMSWRILKIASQVSNNFAKLFCFGFLILVFSQFVINVGMNLGLMPVTGITLPFLSYGGSSLLSLFLGLGVIQSMRARSFRIM